MKGYSILGLTCLLFMALTFVISCSTSAPSSVVPGNLPITSTPVLVPNSKNLVNGMITVQAGGYYDQPFSVTNSMQSVKVSGSFKAQGGLGNDIETYILDDMSFTNWANGHQVNTLYNSGRLTVANINAPITMPGMYHLVFSNEFSIFTSKQVSTTVNLEWNELRYK